MEVAIIGAGFTGLAAAHRLTKLGHEVTIFEKADKPGGLAIGFKDKNWDWTLEEHYHHLFTSDTSILELARRVDHPIMFSRPKTSTLVNNEIVQLDSPITLIKFSYLPFLDRIRTGLVIAYLRFTPFWKPLEQVTAKKFLVKWMGKTSWKVLWEPLFVGKFHEAARQIPASWFWARIKKRSQSLGYPKGGFLPLAQSIEKKIKKQGGEFIYGTSIDQIKKTQKGLLLKTNTGEGMLFDKVVCTLSTPLFVKITKGLPKKYVDKLRPLKGLGAVNLVISLNDRFLSDGTYWLNVNDKHPFLAVVEHTNYQDKKHYGGDHLVYVGNYLPQDHVYFSMSAQELASVFMTDLQTINPEFGKNWIKKSWVFKAPFAQPVIPLNYSKQVPSLRTPIEGLYLANMQQVYPWDRGTNYAVELGEKVSRLI